MLKMNEVKPYIRVDYDDEDSLIALLMANAESYLRDSISGFDLKLENDVEDRFKNKAKLAMLVLIKNWYDNRDFMEFRVGEKVRYTVQSIMLQMDNSYGDPHEI